MDHPLDTSSTDSTTASDEIEPQSPEQLTGSENPKASGTTPCGDKPAESTLAAENTNQGESCGQITATEQSVCSNVGSGSSSSNGTTDKDCQYVEFFLYHESSKFDEAFICFSSSENLVRLTKVNNAVSGGSLWKLRHHFTNCDPMAVSSRITYKYVLSSKSTFSKVPLIGRFVSDNSNTHEECSMRNIRSLTQLDTFHDEKDRDYAITITKSVSFYTKFFLQSVDEKNILLSLERMTTTMQFLHFDFTQAKQMVECIIEQCVSSSLSDVQRLYLCVIMGQLDACYIGRGTLPMPRNNNQVSKGVDRLLSSLYFCAEFKLLSSSNYINLLKKIAQELINYSSSPVWLAFAVYFCPYFGVEYILHQTRGVTKIQDKAQYFKLVDMLLSQMTVENNQDAHQKLLKRVLEIAPDQGAIATIFKSPHIMTKIFACETDKDNFFVDIFQSNCRRSNSRDCCEDLMQLGSIPKKLLSQMSGGYVAPVLLGFAKFNGKEKDKYIETFIQIMIESHNITIFDVSKVLMEFAYPNSKGCSHLLRLLNNKKFQSRWREVPPDKKVKICSSWIIAKVKHEQPGSNESTRTAVVYQVIDELMRSLVNSGDEDLFHEVYKIVYARLLKNEGAGNVLNALRTIETLSSCVQECYKNHAEMMLKNDPQLVRNSSEVLKDFPHSRLGHDLLRFVLCVVHIPKCKANQNPEDVFRAILEWCDVWITLLSENGSIEGDGKFKNGKQIWKDLQTCIMSGDISLPFSQNIYQKKKEISLICAILSTQSSGSERECWRNKYLDKISELVRTKEQCEKKFADLNEAITYIKKISQGIHPISDLLQIIAACNERRDLWTSKTIQELNDSQFWGSLYPLINLSVSLKPLMNSVSFTNVAKSCLEEHCSEQCQGTDHVESSVASMMGLLTCKGIERLQSQWNPVFNNPGLITLDEVKVLLQGLKDNERLEQELASLEKYFHRPIHGDMKKYIKSFVEYPSVLKQVSHVFSVLDTYDLNDPADVTVDKLKQFTSLFENPNQITLGNLHSSMDSVQRLFSLCSENEVDYAVIEELGRSNELLDFVKRVQDEDIRFLIDAVEAHSDQFVSESLVSDLIDVHGFLVPLIKKCQQRTDPQMFLLALGKLCKDHKDMAVKIQQCSTNVNSLSGLYGSVANRGEITKEVIANCLKMGVYSIALDINGTCEAMLEYSTESSRNDGTVAQRYSVYSLSDLHDLRSRAHLIVNSDKSQQETVLSDHDNSQTINFAEFIEHVNLLTDIKNLLEELHSTGYVKYRRAEEKHWVRFEGTDRERREKLQGEKERLNDDVNKWEKSLSDARQQYYFLNYYRSDQLCILYNFLTNRCQVSIQDILSLIHFADPNLNEEDVEKYRAIEQHGDTSNPREMLSVIGNALQEIFASTVPVVRRIVDDQEVPVTYAADISMISVTVKPGQLFVATLEEQSPLTANVMLTLYENTSNAFPEPYQVVFCDKQTTWEELCLLLERCFAKDKHVKDDLFCIANVELLESEVQFELVNMIQEKQGHLGSPDCNGEYRLALICRGGDHHHIVEEFEQYSHHISGMPDLALSQRLKSRWPEVKMFSSTLPGLGKTENIQKEVLKKKMNAVTFPISGPVDHCKLVERLKKLNLKRYHCLHLDIGEVNDPLWLDTFLFQLIVTGMVSSGTQFYHLNTAHVYIEIANTLQDSLLHSFVVSKYFTRVHIKRLTYQDCVISSEVTSHLQIVCQYLDLLDRVRLESTEVCIAGPQKCQPVPAGRCRELLTKYYSPDGDVNFTALNTFLGVLADQLMKFSRSTYFKIVNLKHMRGDEAHGIRTNLFRALLEVSKEFAARSMTSCNSDTLQSLSQKECAQALDKADMKLSAQGIVKRVDRMIHWEDSNHLVVVFHGINSHAISAVYRDQKKVPQNVADLLKSQAVKGKNKLEDFKILNQEQLQEKLERITCAKPSDNLQENMFFDYALTPDNILKMILIILRARANVPVIIMGETGCGKTSLVRYLANVCKITFRKLNFHAGITEDTIKKFIEEKEKEANESGEKIWVFLDEINTCDHLGLISDVMCHHTLLGRPLSDKLVFLAACNPYKLRPKDYIQTAGLQGKNVVDQYSELVYRVHPLPEAMVDYVWDYGSLAPKDEKAYIERMVRNYPAKGCTYHKLLVNLLEESQNFIRATEENQFCVSLRDVQRCIRLVQWFKEMFEKRKEVKNVSRKDQRIRRGQTHLKEHRVICGRYNTELKSIVLALAHCYLSRLVTSKLRENYKSHIMNLLTQGDVQTDCKGNVDAFSAIVRVEEEDYLDRMELPPGTARNAALRENVFVMLVSILNRIPVFVVGKPGCSKSLSIQLIRSNLRGRDSKDPLFRQLPQLYVVSHQGSESSTSEGIIKVFEKAKKYKSHDKDEKVLPVVLLDEVGLAENSKYNPLKVLHDLLDPGDGQLPEVAVVGISNWALDAAKMNRAIHLSRPEPTVDDLYDTGYSLLNADSDDHRSGTIGDGELRCLAEAYNEYQSVQRYANFHGLRDYYSLIKSLSRCEIIDLAMINVALQRNFGGIQDEVSKIQRAFLYNLKQHMLSKGENIIPICELIQENLTDPLARHLMLITSGDSAVGILKQSLNQLNKEIVIIFGSRFEEDLSEDYSYRILSRIILCMERNCILILRDLERIYGSLYDMLNQNYAVVGKRKNCRVALGAYSNPMCYVNDGFRCIVLTDDNKVKDSDPPFLNRFEKQLLRFSDVLSDLQKKIISELKIWVQEMSTIQGHESQFKESNMFAGFYEDTLPSLVLLHSQDSERSNEIVLEACKNDLMWVATPDGVLRSEKCLRSKENPGEVNKFINEYFEKPVHNGLASFLESLLSGSLESTLSTGDEIGLQTVVMTYSSAHTAIPKIKCCENTVALETVRLGQYKSQKKLAEVLDDFWSRSSEKELLVLQCSPEEDSAHMLLARSIIEDKRACYEKVCKENGGVKRRKHVCIIVYLRRQPSSSTEPWQFSFLCGWNQVFIDVLEEPPVTLNQIRTKTIPVLLKSSVWSLRSIAQNDILWCFTCIKYTQHLRSLESILEISKELFNSEMIYQVIENLVLEWVTKNTSGELMDESWQVRVACNAEALINATSLYSAMEQHVLYLVRQPLAKIVFFLEKENAWPPHVIGRSDDKDYEPESSQVKEVMWCEFMSKLCNVSEIPEALGAESYFVGGTRLDLSLPFSQVIVRTVDSVKELILEDYLQVQNDESNYENGRLRSDVCAQQIERYSKVIANVVPEICTFSPTCCLSYMADLFDMISAEFITTSRRQRVSITKCAFSSYMQQRAPVTSHTGLDFCTRLHLFVWSCKEQILDQLRLVNSCQGFLRSHVVESLTEQYLADHKIVTPSEGPNVQSDEALEDAQRHECGLADSETTPVDIEEIQCIIDKENEPGVEEEEPATFQDALVNRFCEEMLPSAETIETSDGGLLGWIRNTSLLLSLVFKVTDRSPASHFLQLCVDFAKLVSVSAEDTTPYSLFLLYAISEKNFGSDYLDAEGAFQSINNDLIKNLPDDVNVEAKTKFSSLLYERCLDTAVDTSAAPFIVEAVMSLQDANLVSLMYLVIFRLLLVEESHSPRIFIDIITNPARIVDCPCLQTIDEVFKHLFQNDAIHHDSYVAVMICDQIQSLMNFTGRYTMGDLNSSDCELLQIVRAATGVLCGNEEENYGLVLLASVALLRAFFEMLSSVIAKRKDITKCASSYSFVMNEINSLLTAGAHSARQSTLRMYFLKQLYQANLSVLELRMLCQESDMLPAIKDAFTENTTAPKAEFFPACRLPEYEEAKAAYWKLREGDDKDMRAFLVTKTTSHHLALVGILVNMIYLKRAAGTITDTDERLADWFYKEFESFTCDLKEILLRVIGRKNFDHPLMQLSPESSIDQIEIAMLIIHISCMLANSVGNDKCPRLKQYLTHPENCNQSYMLAQGVERIRKPFKKSEDDSCASTCSCGMRLKFKIANPTHNCPSCGAKNDAITENNGKQIPQRTSSKGYTPLAPETAAKNPENGMRMSHWDDCVVAMNPSVYRSLHLLVHICLYAGVAMGISSKVNLSSLLNLKPSDTKSGMSDAVQFCFGHIEADLKSLGKILGCQKEIVIKAMYLVVDKCAGLIRGDVLDHCECATPDERREWEERYTVMVKDVLRDALGPANVIKQVTRIEREEQAVTMVEDKVQELDPYPADPTLQEQQLKRLFRVTKQPSFQEFYTTFMNTPKDVQEKHDFLSLFFANIQELAKIRCLFHLLKWTRLVSSSLTHRICRIEAKDKSINDFITRHLGQDRSQEELKSLKELFNSFKEAWNKVRPFVNQLKELEQMKEMPRIQETHPIGYCLIESDLGLYLRIAIQMLVSLQNSLLDELIVLSTRHQHPALGFLELDDGCCGTPSVSIQNAKEKDIISFQWSDQLLIYAQNNLEYGQGEEICYDLERMEIELTKSIAFGKRHLTGSLNKFMFSKELFHSSGPMLTEIRKLFVQSATLPDNMRQGLSELKESRIKDVQVLLQHIEVVIFLLKFKLKNIDVEMTLKTFAEQWQKLLPSPFPVELLPKRIASSMKLKHVSAFYESLEDLLADGAIEGLPDKFRHDLEEDMDEILSTIVDKTSGSITLQAFLTALRRFVFRYLSSEKFLPEQSTRLSTCLQESSLWLDATPPDPNIIPQEITLEFIYSVIMHLKELDKERKRSSTSRVAGKFFNQSTSQTVVSMTPRGTTKRPRRHVSLQFK